MDHKFISQIWDKMERDGSINLSHCGDQFTNIPGAGPSCAGGEKVQLLQPLLHPYWPMRWTFQIEEELCNHPAERLHLFPAGGLQPVVRFTCSAFESPYGGSPLMEKNF